MADQLLITPKTRVLELLNSYPQLEELLVELVPTFEKLKNPLLRRTVARVTTLQQAASIGKIGVDKLVNHLRQSVGQTALQGAEEVSFVTEKPAWFSPERVTGRLDIRGMLASGDQPIHILIHKLQQLKEGAIFQVLSPFLPAPLIDKATSLEMLHWVDRSGEGEEELYSIYFTRLP